MKEQPNPLALLRVRYAIAFLRGLEEKGIDGRALWREAGLAETLLEDPEAWMPVRDLCAFLEVAVHRTGYETLGLDAGIAPRRQHSEFSLKLLLSPTLYETLSSICSSAHEEDTSANWRLVRDRSTVWMQSEHRGEPSEGARQIGYFRYACLLEIVRFAADETWLPTRVDFQSGRCGSALKSKLLDGVEVQFNRPQMQFSIPPLLLSRPLHNIPDAPVGLSHYTASIDSFESALLEVVRYQMLSGKPQLDDAAHRLGLSRRTLQRRLAEQNVTYQRLLQHVRMETAKEWLSEAEYSVTDIASRLGYGKVTNFSRAFRKGFGTTPREYRQLVNSPADGPLSA